MISRKELHEVLPEALSLHIFKLPTKYQKKLEQLLDNLLTESDYKHYTKIEGIELYSFSSLDKLEENNELEGNEFAIYIGKQMVLKGSAPENMHHEGKELFDFFDSIVSSISNIIDLWYEKIIEAQEINHAKLQELEAECDFEMLYTYYNFHDSPEAFFYLKKLATRYPYSRYGHRLQRIYKKGKPHWHKKSEKLANKLKISNTCEIYRAPLYWANSPSETAP